MRGIDVSANMDMKNLIRNFPIFGYEALNSLMVSRTGMSWRDF